MGNRLGQLEIPGTPGTKKEAKKQRTRKLRKKSKKIDDPNPQHNRYSGYT